MTFSYFMKYIFAFSHFSSRLRGTYNFLLKVSILGIQKNKTSLDPGKITGDMKSLHERLEGSPSFQATTSPNTLKSLTLTISSLPVELCQTILSHLSLKDIKSIRLTSHHWATIGCDYLLSPVFNTLPHQDDINRLHQISLHPTLSSKIQTINMNHAEINEYHARHNTYFLNYMLDPEDRLESQIEMTTAYSKSNALNQRFLPLCCDLEKLTEIFGNLENLRSINITLQKCPFQGPEWPSQIQEIWRLPTTRAFPRPETRQRFHNLLVALSSNLPTTKLTSLTHDRLPLDIFSLQPPTLHLYTTVFKSLRKLNLTFDLLPISEEDIHLSTLANLLSQIPNLQALELGFIPTRRKLNLHTLLTSFKSHPNLTFPALQDLTISGFIGTENEIVEFILSLRNLKRLKLGAEGNVGVGRSLKGRNLRGMWLEEGGTWDSLWWRIRRVMGERGLERFVIQGQFWEADGQEFSWDGEANVLFWEEDEDPLIGVEE